MFKISASKIAPYYEKWNLLLILGENESMIGHKGHQLYMCIFSSSDDN